MSLLLNIVVSGVLTGLLYGLMSLVLSVIFGIVRVVNFAHGEFAVIAMYAAFVLFRDFGLDPVVAMLPVAVVFFGIGYLLQSALVNRFVGRAEHEQFILLVALGMVIVNGLLIVFGVDGRAAHLSYGL